MNNHYRNKKIPISAKGEVCTMQLSICTQNPETTVFAHSNYQEDGKGMGIKADDCFGAYMCSACHDEFDGRTHKTKLDFIQMYTMFHGAMKRTWKCLLQKGVLV